MYLCHTEMERMKHYLKKFEEQIHLRPDEPALCDYQGTNFSMP